MAAPEWMAFAISYQRLSSYDPGKEDDPGEKEQGKKGIKQETGGESVR